jgi:hypothetical protein
MEKKWRSIIINNLLALYFVNNILLIPRYAMAYYKTDLFDERIINKTLAKEKFIDLEGDERTKAYKYLKISSILVDDYLKYDSAINNYDDITTAALEKRIRDCKQFAEFTYSDFLYFTKITNNKSLRNNVRLASGYVKTDSKNTGHRWLEIKSGEKWVPFEPTSLKGEGHNFIKEINGNNFTHIDSLLLYKSFDEYIPTCRLSIDENDKARHYPEIVHALTEPKGYVYEALSNLKNLLSH